MTDRPIIFSAPMIKALLDGGKTQTRRLATSPLARCVPGDRLWVRENLLQRPMANFLTGEPTNAIVAAYAADNGDVVNDAGFNLAPWWRSGGGLPSIHMPRWASRLTLTVTDVRVQRLHDITDADALAEGIEPERYCPVSDSAGLHACGSAEPTDPVAEYRDLWDRLHGAGAWDSNPEVAALTFTVERQNIDARIAA
ncbi:Phage-related protein (plasmid) [Rhodovastum atsumiense]|uniref:ASCH domain-containing protein n=1 Tax=Rhodovastum atsumiense TaxID=504468 RepID=A0A5M6IMY9_9PROT|nr:hypothetical protein [Rhodovastum atsumiense]KAA5609621.1 hypothetical protein F1189_22935 [Rhodovastum atsumiense]CAH2606482.1 Phage-related protein [Rhodovastum atsumiense]